jgi:hypothetical protein
MTTDIKFGTDGWRATPETGLNEENISICTQSFAKYMLDHREGDKEVHSWILHTREFLRSLHSLQLG